MRRYFKAKQEIMDKTIYEFDAFVAFNGEDIKWVKDELITRMEECANLRLCIHHRDFQLGVPIEENIVEAIAKSKKTILVITEKFARSNWCKFEVQMARQRLFEEGRAWSIPSKKLQKPQYYL